MRRLALFLTLVGGLLLGTALPAAADVTEEWKVAITVEADGSFVVKEQITQTFETSRRGIFRYIPVTERLAEDGLIEVPDGTVEDWFQKIKIDVLRISASAGTPNDAAIERPSRHDSQGLISIRIGDEDTYITGTHTYQIDYRVEGAMLALENGDSVLRWDVVGDGWQQNIKSASVTVAGPGLKSEASACAVGQSYFGPMTCTSETSGGTFTATTVGLSAYSPMSVEVVFDGALVAPSTPLLQRRFTLAGAMWGDAKAWPLFLLSLVFVTWRVGSKMYREGRDRETRGDVTVDGRTDTTHAQYAGAERTRRLFTPRPVPIEFRPPDDLKPGELGLIIDERVDPVDIAATIVDMAVRGYLVIEEDQNKVLWWTRTDWTLRETDKSPSDLMAYEKHLYDGLFSGRSEVSVSDLKGTFATEYGKAERALYEQGRKRAWFAGRPDKVRAKWLGIAIGALVLSMGAFVVALYFSRMAVVAVPFVLSALVMLAAHRWMPRRTPKGSELLTRTLGFREFIETAETDRARFAEQEHLFIEYLPYAVVFGATEKWAQAFADLSIMTTGAGLGGWYIWHSGGGGFNARAFSSGLSDFSTNMGNAAVTSPPSSSSGGGGGFSGGGGFGGGGGGSW